MDIHSLPNAALLRRFAAMLYDAFLIVAIWMTSTTLIVALLTEGGTVRGTGFQLFLYLELGAFYVYFWHARGQTLGMQVWKIKLVNEAGSTLSWGECIRRFLAATLAVAPLGAGFLWMVFHPKRLALHDVLSRSRVIYLGKKPYRSEQQP